MDSSKVMEEDFIYWPNELSKEDVDIVGELAANLSEINNSGVNVPQFFVISKKLFRFLFDTKGLFGEIFQILKGATLEDLDNRVSKIRDLLLSYELDEDIRKRILEAYHKINISGRDYTAIGKKALELISTGRDIEWVNMYLSPHGKFPRGKSILNVKQDEKVIKALFDLWASIFSKEGLLFIKKNNIALSNLTYSTIVQKMVNSDKSGYIEMINDKYHIYSVWGIVEPLIRNEIKPDIYIVNNENLTIIKKEISEQNWKINRDIRTGNLIKKDVPSTKAFSSVLSENELFNLLNLAKKVFSVLGKNLRIYWAIEDNRFYITSVETQIKESQIEEEIHEEQDVDNTKNFENQEENHSKTAEEEISETETEHSIIDEFINDEEKKNNNSGQLTVPKPVNTRELLNENNKIFNKTATKIYLILKDVDKALEYKDIACDGIVLSGEIVCKKLGKNPIFLIKDDQEAELINFFTENIQNIAKIFYPKPVIYKTYYEDKREFSMDDYGKLLELELKALKRVTTDYNLDNISIMPASIKTSWDYKLFKNLLSNLDLGRNVNVGISIGAPSVLFILDEIKTKDIAIDFNRLFRLLLGVNKKEWEIIKVQDKSIEKSIEYIIEKSKKNGAKCMIIGDNLHPETLELFVKLGINVIAVHPNDIKMTRDIVESVEKQMILEALRKNETNINSN